MLSGLGSVDLWRGDERSDILSEDGRGRTRAIFQSFRLERVTRTLRSWRYWELFSIPVSL